MSLLFAAWSGLAGVASAVTLVALVGAVVSIITLWRLHRHYRIAEAAERLEPVDMTYVVKKYLPTELQTQKSFEELPNVKRVIQSRWPRWKWLAIGFSVALPCFAVPTSFLVRRNLELEALSHPTPAPRENIDVLQAIQGVWGWRVDYLQSCSQNPQAIALTGDRKKLTVDYAKPHEPLQHLEFAVVSTAPDTMVLKPLNFTIPSSSGPVLVTLNFQDANTFLLSSSNKPVGSSGTIERCR